MLTNLLLYRFAIFNLLMLGVMGHAHYAGAVEEILTADRTGIVWAILALFALTWSFSWWRVLRVGRWMNMSKRADPRCPHPSRRSKDLEKSAWLRESTEWMTTLGLIGTVIGFWIALGGVDGNALTTADGVQDSVGELMAGMRVAISTTIVGAVLGMWNWINQRMLSTAAECFWRDVGRS